MLDDTIGLPDDELPFPEPGRITRRELANRAMRARYWRWRSGNPNSPLDRRDVNGNYERGTRRWAAPKEQHENRRV